MHPEDDDDYTAIFVMAAIATVGTMPLFTAILRWLFND